MLTPLAPWGLSAYRQQGLVRQFEPESPVMLNLGREPMLPRLRPDPAQENGRQEEAPPLAEAAPHAEPMRPEPGLFRLEIPALGVKYMVMPGIEDADLARGPGHYPQTPLPGTGNAAIAGHRTWQGGPSYFHSLHKLKEGDEIRVAYAEQELTFLVERIFLTSPLNLSVLAPTDHPTLTLTTCDRSGPTERRLIVQARLREAQLAYQP